MGGIGCSVAGFVSALMKIRNYGIAAMVMKRALRGEQLLVDYVTSLISSRRARLSEAWSYYV